MKQLALFTLLSFGLSSSKAQQLELQQKEILKNLLKQKNLRSKDLALEINDASEYSNSPLTNLLYENKDFKVYALPLENMRCLVPKNLSPIPTDKSAPEIFIPNPLYKKKK